MRRVRDAQGRAWDVVVGRESWGAFVALFVPAGDHGEVRQARLTARGRTEAETEVDTLDTQELLTLLARSEPKELA